MPQTPSAWSEEASREDEVNSAGPQVLKALQTVPSARTISRERQTAPQEQMTAGRLGGGEPVGKEGFSEEVTSTPVLKERDGGRSCRGVGKVFQRGVCSRPEFCQGE